MTKVPLVFHKTFASPNHDFVSDDVMECVDELAKQNYKKIRVTVHEPVPGDGVRTSTMYSTTVIATQDDVLIDIGFTPPN